MRKKKNPKVGAVWPGKEEEVGGGRRLGLGQGRKN